MRRCQFAGDSRQALSDFELRQLNRRVRIELRQPVDNLEADNEMTDMSRIALRCTVVPARIVPS